MLLLLLLLLYIISNIPVHVVKLCRGQISLHFFLYLALDGVDCTASRLGSFIPRERVSFAHAGILTPYRSARNLPTKPSTLSRLRSRRNSGGSSSSSSSSSSSISSSNDKSSSEFYKLTMLSFRHMKLKLAYGVGDSIKNTPVNWCGVEVSVQESKISETENYLQ